MASYDIFYKMEEKFKDDFKASDTTGKTEDENNYTVATNILIEIARDVEESTAYRIEACKLLLEYI